MIPTDIQLNEDARKSTIVEIIDWLNSNRDTPSEDWHEADTIELLMSARDILEASQSFLYLRAVKTEDGVCACPFCGKFDTVIGALHVHCKNCGTRGPMRNASWNSLSLPSATRSDQEAVESILAGDGE